MKAVNANGSLPPVGKASDNAATAGERGKGDGRTAAAIPRQDHRNAGERQEQAGHRAGEAR